MVTIKFQPIFFIIALAFALNLHTLAEDSFWGDEIFTASFAASPPTETIRWTAGDIHPPLYYLFAGAFARLTIPPTGFQLPTAASDWLWRFPSVMVVTLVVAVTYNLARHLSRLTANKPAQSKTSLYAALLLALSPVAIKYGQEARMHALFMLLAAMSTWLLLKAISGPQQWTRWLAFALATAAGIYTMYFGFLILAAQMGFVLCLLIKLRTTPYALPKVIIQRFVIAVVLASVLYLPWWPVLFNILRKRAAVGAIEGGVGVPTDFILAIVPALGPPPAGIAWIFLLLFLIGLILLARDFWPLAVLGALWLALPILAPIFLGDPRALQFRYAFVLPVYLTTIAYAVEKSSQMLPVNQMVWQPAGVATYIVWLLATFSFIGALTVYQQVKPNWRGAATYLDEHAAPADIILFGPLWDDGRFIGYYYRGQAELLTPATMVTNIEGRVEGLRAGGGKVWAVNRFAPAESPVSRNVDFTGVVISEPLVAVYEPALLTEAAIDLAAQAVDAAYPWAAQAEAQGVLNPDPRTARAAALRAWGDVLLAAGRPAEAVTAYQTAVDIFPGWVGGFIALGEAYETVGNLPEAVKAYQQAVAFNLNWQGAEAHEAAALAEAENWPAALEKYHHIIDR
jgi:4-amino-4-deoxy-L-arabinose transferase-like glycosyltransferase